MASIVTCPGCTTQLAIPDAAVADSRVECPQCAAEFSMCETIQLALPTARILPARQEPTAVEPDQDMEIRTTVETPASDAPLSSWEARLKKALAAETEPAQEPVGYETFEPAPDVSEAFSIESPLKKQCELPHTADDFSEVAAQEQTLVAPSTSLATDVTLDDKSTALEICGKNDNRRKSKRRWWPRVVGLVLAGPVLGTLLGFYSLLWIKGPQADYLRLSQFLPETLLPAAMIEQPGEEESPPPRPARSLVEETPSESGKPSPTTLLDEQVQPATIEQPLALRRQSVNITAQEFSQLVADARAVLPNLLEGGLSDQDAFNRKGQAYMALCRLAEKFAFIHQLGLSPQAHDQVRLAKQLFARATSDSTVLGDLTHIASRWWEYGDRGNQGIFLVGQVGKRQAVGTRWLCQLLLAGDSGVEIPVLFEQMSFPVRDWVVVVGRVEALPQQFGLSGAAAPSPVVIPLYSYSLPTPPAR